MLKQYFPDARVVATEPTIKRIKASLPNKLAFWPPKMGANAPKNVPLPELLKGHTITLEGQTLEIRSPEDRSYVWIPSIKAVVGGTNVFAGLHAWTADTPTQDERTAWIRKLDDISALKPVIVVPGHAAPGEKQDVSQVQFTRQYLERFEGEVKKAKDSVALKQAMQQAYPKAGLEPALDIGSKVVKGEMKW